MKSLNVVIVALIVIGIVIGVGLLVLEEFEGQIGTTSTTVVNETVIPATAGVYVAFNSTTAGVFCYNSFSIVEVRNATGTGLVISSGNYSSQPATGKITNLSSYDANSGWNVTYTYNSNNGGACEGLNDTISATATIPTWLTIIVLVLIVGIILYLVFTKMPSMGGSNGESDGVIARV